MEDRAGLLAVVGEWITSGFVVGDPPARVEGTDIYEAFPGDHFLVHHVDVTVGSHPVRAIEIIGEPAPGGEGYLARSFDSEGNAEVMKLQIDENGVFRFEGGGDIAPAARPGADAAARVRAMLTVAPHRKPMSAIWERSEDGTAWSRWMEIGFTRRA
jgi:hypothetical protein